MPSYTQYMRQMAVLDANDDDIESWITVKGNHIPIKKGQSKEDAVKSFIEKKGGKEKGGDWESQGRETAKREASHEFKKRSGVGLTFTELGKGDHGSEKEAEPKYDPEFETVRKNALANPNLYGGKYTQKSKAEAYKEYKRDTSSKENAQKANAFVNSELVSKNGWGKEINSEIKDLQRRAEAVGIRRGAKLQFPDGSIQEVEITISDLVDTKKDGKTVTHTLGKLEAGIKNGEIKVLSGKKENGRYERPVHISEALNDLVDDTDKKRKS